MNAAEELEPGGSVAAREPSRAINSYRLLADVPVRLSVQVGSTSMKLSDLLALSEGSVVELDRQTHELVDVMVNGTLVARGEVVMINGRFGVRVIDVVNTDPDLASVERRA